MPRVHVRVLRRPPYNGDVFESGLARVGYKSADERHRPEPGDLLVLWNRYQRDETMAQRYEAAGGRVLVVENGYLGRDHEGQTWYALALHQHGGAGEWKSRPDRVGAIPFKLYDWRNGGQDIVVLAQRGLGSKQVREPTGWATDTARELRTRTDRKVRVRPHPGAQANCTQRSLLDDIKHSHACVTWASGAGIKALCLGVPVFYGLDKWIGRNAARNVREDIEAPFKGDRSQMLADVAGATWSLDEIQSGEAFLCLSK